MLCVLGVLGDEWAVWMPQSIEALNGSCVLIPCRFDIPDNYEKYLALVNREIWRKGRKNDPIVFHSSIARTLPEENKIIGTLIGNLENKNCTTVLDSFLSSYNGRYFLRLESSSDLKYNFATGVQINVQGTAFTVMPFSLCAIVLMQKHYYFKIKHWR